LRPTPVSLTDTTGGWRWHLRALLASRRWQPTCAAIAQWLDDQPCSGDSLLLIGPSAGWMMHTPWLSRFRRIDAFDLDPSAERLFRMRHGWQLQRAGVTLNFHRRDAFDGLDRILAEYPKATLFFDNVLGQQIYRFRDDLPALERRLNTLSRQLAGRHWGSIHDWMSGPARANDPHSVVPRHLSDITVMQSGYRLGERTLSTERCAQELMSPLSAHGEWQDHLSSGIFPAGTSIRLIPWAFLPGHWHWLQAGWVRGYGD
jgi:hypothetical protein